MQTAENKLTFKNQYDIIILLYGAHPHTGEAVGEGDILRDGKRPRNDQSIQPTDDPNTDTEKEKEKDIDTRCLARRSAQRKSIFFSGKGRSAGTPPPFGGQYGFVGVAAIGCPALKEVLSIS